MVIQVQDYTGFSHRSPKKARKAPTPTPIPVNPTSFAGATFTDVTTVGAEEVVVLVTLVVVLVATLTTEFAVETAPDAMLSALDFSAPPAVEATLSALETTELASWVASDTAELAMLRADETTELDSEV